VTSEVEAGADLVVRHPHLLPGDVLDRLAELLQVLHDQDDPQAPWVSMTVLADAPGDEVETRLLGFFPRTVQVPPLRHHISDVPALVRLLLNQAGSSDLELSPAARNQLMRLSWNGNVTQLRRTLRTLGRRVRSGVADVGDLPPGCHSTLRRGLTPMETLERDAIVEALAVHDGDKSSAAQSLGVSRATIYRKIRYFELQV
jgi:transcriptional regulator of acetoin/glycerol metabolism